MLTVVPGDGSGHEGGKDRSPSLIDEIVREGARPMLAEALQAEVDAYIARAALAMAFKLIEAAQARWRAVNAPHLVALVRAGARFERGVLIEREAAA
jgi:hypothetical protein